MKFFVPGKTFLVGEYAVLVGGVALGLATKPYFEIDLLADEDPAAGSEKNDYTAASDLFHPQSPAGLYLIRHPQKALMKFKDRYQEMGVQGGFGRSTAEYLAALTPELIQKKQAFHDLLAEYRDLHSHLKTRPSGIDLAFQYFGGVVLADQTLNFYQNFDWNFLDYDFYLVSTGFKLPTHQHLADLNFKSLEDLPQLSDEIAKLYAENKPQEFFDSMKTWADRLEQKGLTHLNSVHLRRHLEKTGDVILVKPCGALGADVVCVFYKTEKALAVEAHIKKLQLKILADSAMLAQGYISQVRHYWSDHVDRSLSPV